jgi:hypothetical protein
VVKYLAQKMVPQYDSVHLLLLLVKKLRISRAQTIWVLSPYAENFKQKGKANDVKPFFFLLDFFMH